ncbi:unnamed protein product [Amoebophrya sp. A120]|nr:unnamed protein product [Amoebophrya sp. A120]|eukprot:GSA120T00025184001.1
MPLVISNQIDRKKICHAEIASDVQVNVWESTSICCAYYSRDFYKQLPPDRRHELKVNDKSSVSTATSLEDENDDTSRYRNNIRPPGTIIDETWPTRACLWMKLTEEEREQMQLSGCGGGAAPSTQDKSDSRNYCQENQELETACWLDFLEADVRGEVMLHTPPELQQKSLKQDQSTTSSTSSSTCSTRQKSRLAFEWMMSIGYKISCPCYGGFIDVAGSFSVVDFCSEYYYDGDYEMKRMEELVAEEKMKLLMNESKSKSKSSPDEQKEDEERKRSIVVDRSALAEKNLKKSNGPQVTCFVDEGSIQEWKGYFPPGMFVKMHKRLVGLLQTQGVYMVREMLVHDWIEAVRDRYEVDI